MNENIENFLQGILQEVNYLSQMNERGEITGEIDDIVLDYVKSAEDMLDDACTTFNDFKAGVWE